MTPEQKKTSVQMRQQAKELLEQAEKLEKEERLALRMKIDEMIEEAGFSTDDIFPEIGFTRSSPAAKPSSPSRAKAGVKYRDPENSQNTYTGKGRKPNWILEKEANDPDFDLEKYAV